MSFEKLIAKAAEIGRRAAERKRRKLAENNDSSADIQVKQIGDGIAFIGRQLRRRFVTNSSFRRRIR